MSPMSFSDTVEYGGTIPNNNINCKCSSFNFTNREYVAVKVQYAFMSEKYLFIFTEMWLFQHR